MLDTDTKRRIDTARDILVGKVPDPKSQVEQITIALIYKFMDDMDLEAEELGGKRKFFAKDFARYGWTKLMRSGLGGHETLNLYAEAIAKMPENPGIPPLFRDIFKNAYLPYRDPETLRAFLKVIDEFEYDHSERLGDAFEYLLSVLGSQGDAGQFRTPRHIIDFIVEIIDPKKHETVLDPACGTAGFLISSYKHILRNNTINMDAQDGQDQKDNSPSRKSCSSMLFSALTPDERGRLAANFRGYDISPDMVRLSLVNMYLHGFTDPHIFEYDTLTSLERWNEYADVILANPPFMSPKGGIKPHNRFSVQSKRSEVLFVDYMAEHLTPNGRAGIIVPEGIIFQSQNAYTQLRKMLVEEYLVAVVSLPAGVFNPYSGVKTSILILDKALAKQTDRIAFFKVENDGFNLGAQRRPIDKNDLPQVLKGIKEYLNMDRQDRQDGTVMDSSFSSCPSMYKKKNRGSTREENKRGAQRLQRETEHLNMDGHDKQDGRVMDSSCSSCPSMLATLIKDGKAIIVLKDKIAANGDYNLSGERYREGVAQSRLYPSYPLAEVCDIFNGSTPSKHEPRYWENGTVPWFTIEDIRKSGRIIRKTEKFITTDALNETSLKLLPAHSVLLCCTASVGEYAFSEIELTTNQQFNGLVVKKTFADRLLPKYLFFISSHFKDELIRLSGKTSFNFVSVGTLKTIKIPLPPLEVQKEIVAEIEGYQKVIDGARAVFDNYRPHIPIHPDWPMVKLGEVFTTSSGGTPPKGKAEYYENGTIPWLKSGEVAQGLITVVEEKITELALKNSSAKIFPPGTVLVAMYGATAGQVGLLGIEAATNQAVCGILPHLRVIPAFLYFHLKSRTAELVAMSTGGAQPNISQAIIRSLVIPLPPLETQRAIVAEIEAEQALVNANRELIARMEKKIQGVLARVWGEETGDTPK